MDSEITEPDSLFPAALKECLYAPVWCLTHPFHVININSHAYQNSIIAAIQFLRDTGKKIIDERRKAMKIGEDVLFGIFLGGISHILGYLIDQSMDSMDSLMIHQSVIN